MPQPDDWASHPAHTTCHRSVYGKITFIHRQCLAFVAHRERELLHKVLSSMYVAVDRQAHSSPRVGDFPHGCDSSEFSHSLGQERTRSPVAHSDQQ